MSDNVQRHPMTLKRVVYRIPGEDAVSIQRDVEYRTTDAGVLTMDLYRPLSPPRRSRGASLAGEPNHTRGHRPSSSWLDTQMWGTRRLPAAGSRTLNSSSRGD